MIRNLDINLVRTFVTVASTGSMTLAADRLALTQGAISQQIKRLEEALQCQLFDRSRRSLKLNKQGRHLLGLSKRLLDANDEIWNEMVAPAVQGEVRFGLPDDLVTTYLPLALDGFAADHPTIEVSLVSDSSPNLLAGLNKGDIDIALVEEPLGQTDEGECQGECQGECLSVERLLWVGSKYGTANRRRPLPLSIVSETCAFRSPTVDALEVKGIAWKPVFENGTIDATMTTVRADLAVTVSLASVIPPDLEVLGQDTGLPDLPSFAINLYLNTSVVNPAAHQLARHLRDGIRGVERLRA